MDNRYQRIAVDKIVPNERNPRTASNFTADQLLGLRRSVEEMGVLIPLIVQKYEQGLFMLIEGERRWTVAKALGMKEIPAIVLSSKLDPEGQVSVMSHLHEHRKGWDAADHLLAVQVFMANSPEMSKAEVAAALGIAEGTLNDRLRVLEMGKPAIDKIARGKLDTTTALRAGQLARSIVKKRPALAKDLGGEKKIEAALIRKSEARPGGVSQEYTALKPDVSDTTNVSDETLAEYVKTPAMTSREMRQQSAPAAAQRASILPIARRALGIAEELRGLVDQDLSEAPNLRALRDALAGLKETVALVDEKVTTLLLEHEVPAQTERITRRRRPGLQTGEVQASLAESEKARREPEANGSHKG